METSEHVVNSRGRLEESARLALTLVDSPVHLSLADLADRMIQALASGSKVLVAGNGGSAATANHFAAELVGGLGAHREPLPAISLAESSAALTAIGNDFEFDRVFEWQIRALGRRGDILITLSTSGTSSNVLLATATAKSLGLHAAAFTGQETPLGSLADTAICIPSEDTALIQEYSLHFCHSLAVAVVGAFDQATWR